MIYKLVLAWVNVSHTCGNKILSQLTILIRYFFGKKTYLVLRRISQISHLNKKSLKDGNVLPGCLRLYLHIGTSWFEVTYFSSLFGLLSLVSWWACCICRCTSVPVSNHVARSVLLGRIISPLINYCFGDIWLWWWFPDFVQLSNQRKKFHLLALFPCF